MENSMIDFFKAAYQNDSSCILILDKTGKLIWNNDSPAPFDVHSSLNDIFHFSEDNLPASGDYSYALNDILYEYHLTNVSNDYLIISCSDVPMVYRLFENRSSRESIENFVKQSKQEMLGISSSASQLNDYFEDFEDDNISTDELNEQINIIMNNCSQVLREHYLIEEFLRYYSDEETKASILNCSDILKTFAKNCREVFGPRGTTRVICDPEPNVPIYASRQRLEFFLLCVLIILRKDYPGIFRLEIGARSISDETVINMKLIPVGEEDEGSHLMSKFVPLYKDTPLHEMENIIIKRFLERYNGILIDSTENENKSISMRFPTPEISNIFKLKTPKRELYSQTIITPYHAVLSEISDFRYY
ncbi:MAG: hypothetical protein ACI4JD_06510 [Ruminococcus sp.]